MEHAEAQPRDGSALCVQCGLCCQGVLHDAADLKPHEVDHAASLGMAVNRDAKHGPEFRLPCPLLNDTQCSVYPDRPSTCRGYKCGLLRRYVAGTVPLDQALAFVAEAKRLLAGVKAQTPDGITLREARDAWIARNLAVQQTGSGTALQGVAGAHLSMTLLQLFLDERFRADHDQFAFQKTSID